MEKVRIKIWYTLVTNFKKTKFYPFLYRSYWNSIIVKQKESNEGNEKKYLGVKPTPSAGIGHQIANWISCYWFSKKFELRFSHIPFTSPHWELFLGLGIGEDQVTNLIQKGYLKRRLPLFDEDNIKDINMIRRIIDSYNNKVIFICEYNPFYKNQYGVINELQQKFYSAPARLNNDLSYNDENFNIAIHVRRGDILKDPNNVNLQMRFIANDYFTNVLGQVLKKIRTSKPVHIYFFSQGKKEDFPEFETFENLHWCLDMGAQDSFLHMVYADLSITSKSSFSYKPALLNKNIKVCPKNFWHGYPDSKDWIMVDENGNLSVKEIKTAVYESDIS